MSETDFSLKDLGLKFDDAASVKTHLDKISSPEKIKTIDLSGNTYGVEACEEVARTLDKCTNIEVRSYYYERP